MNEEISTEVIPEEVLQEEESASDPETLVEGSAADSEIQSEVETETNSEVDTEVDTEVVTKEDLEEIKESLDSNNDSFNVITTMLLESENSDTPDYTETLETLYQEDITFNNNFCIGIESLVLALGIISGLIFGFVFKEILKR